MEDVNLINAAEWLAMTPEAKRAYIAKYRMTGAVDRWIEVLDREAERATKEES